MSQNPELLRLGSIDIETLSLRQDCVIYEVGFAGVNIALQPQPDATPQYVYPTIQSLDECFASIYSSTVYIRVLPQVFKGRHIDPDTVEFHKNLFDSLREGDLSELVFEDYLGQTSGEAVSPELALLRIQDCCSGMDEIWINHPSFDKARLDSLAEDFDFGSPLWDFRKEFDVATLRRGRFKEQIRSVVNSYEAQHPPRPGEGKHTGRYDAEWNLRTVLTRYALDNEVGNCFLMEETQPEGLATEGPVTSKLTLGFYRG